MVILKKSSVQRGTFWQKSGPEETNGNTAVRYADTIYSWYSVS